MSRSRYTDDLDGATLSLYRGRIIRTLRGKRGKAFLRELAEAMDAMPDKRLIAGALIEDGECCPIGVVCKARGLDVAGVDCEDPQAVGLLVGISSTLAAEIEYENDEGSWCIETPEKRWTRIRTWVSEMLALAPLRRLDG